MSTRLKVVGFLVGLAAVFGAAFGVGAVADPDTEPVADHGGADHEEGTGHAEHGEAAASSVHLALTQRSYEPGQAEVSFQVQDADGMPVTAYDVKHEKELHLIVLDTSDLTDFQHVHPVRAADGTWTAALTLAPGTSYRLYADGSSEGADFLATADLFATGRDPGPQGVPEPSVRDQVDGFTVDLEQADGSAAIRVSKDGMPVQLEPYLGALGHLVVIRVDDLAYLHVHPEEGDTPVFSVAGLAPGSYRYFFDFQVDGVVHTASFTHVIDAATTMDMEEDDHDSH